MIDRVRGYWSAVLRWLKLSAPQGHMEMLRGVVARREDERLAQAAASTSLAAAKPVAGDRVALGDDYDGSDDRRA